MKNGLIFENGELIYYKDDKPKHAGVVRVDGDIYYISSKGRAVRGEHIVHGEMTNGILRRGTYTFGDDYKLIKGSYIAPKKRKKKHNLWDIFGIKPKNIQKNKSAKKHKNKLMPIFAVFGFLVLLMVAFWLGRQDAAKKESDNAALNGSQQESTVNLPNFEEDVLLCSKSAKLEYDGQMELSTAIKTGTPYRPFYFAYHLENTTGTLFLGEKEDLSDSREYILSEEYDHVAIDNLKVDTTYYYKVVVDEKTYAGTFHTAPATRFVYIPGLVNTRDIGGGFTQDGKRVKQGMLIRGVELDGLVNANYFIPEEELANMQDSFGFRFDLDLRDANTYTGGYVSRLEIPHKFYGAPMYGEIFSADYRDSLRSIFADLADPDKYPMYLHCTWGTDRTGTIVFLLQGVLNVSEEDMVREYRLTSYAKNDSELAESDKMRVIINGLQSYAGDTLQEKIVSFLIMDIGVTEKEIESIRSIFLEE